MGGQCGRTVRYCESWTDKIGSRGPSVESKWSYQVDLHAIHTPSLMVDLSDQDGHILYMKICQTYPYDNNVVSVVCHNK